MKENTDILRYLKSHVVDYLESPTVLPDPLTYTFPLMIYEKTGKSADICKSSNSVIAKTIQSTLLLEDNYDSMNAIIAAIDRVSKLPEVISEVYTHIVSILNKISGLWNPEVESELYLWYKNSYSDKLTYMMLTSRDINMLKLIWKKISKDTKYSYLSSEISSLFKISYNNRISGLSKRRLSTKRYFNIMSASTMYHLALG